MEFIREAGWVVYPVLVVGLLSLRWAALYARTRDPELRATWIIWMALTLAFGVFGTVLGLQASVQYISTTPDKWLFLIGLRESLHNSTIAIGFVIVSLLMVLAIPRRSGALLQPSAAAALRS